MLYKITEIKIEPKFFYKKRRFFTVLFPTHCVLGIKCQKKSQQLFIKIIKTIYVPSPDKIKSTYEKFYIQRRK